jgi:hypothetical protein
MYKIREGPKGNESNTTRKKKKKEITQMQLLYALGRPSVTQSGIAFLLALFLHQFAQRLMMS